MYNGNGYSRGNWDNRSGLKEFWLQMDFTVLGFRMTRLTQANEILQIISLQIVAVLAGGVAKRTERLDMMNIKSAVIFLLRFTAVLALVVVPFPSKTALLNPIWSVIVNVAAFVVATQFARLGFLPLSKALAIAKKPLFVAGSEWGARKTITAESALTSDIMTIPVGATTSLVAKSLMFDETVTVGGSLNQSVAVETVCSNSFNPTVTLFGGTSYGKPNISALRTAKRVFKFCINRWLLIKDFIAVGAIYFNLIVSRVMIPTHVIRLTFATTERQLSNRAWLFANERTTGGTRNNLSMILPFVVARFTTERIRGVTQFIRFNTKRGLAIRALNGDHNKASCRRGVLLLRKNTDQQEAGAEHKAVCATCQNSILPKQNKYTIGVRQFWQFATAEEAGIVEAA